MPYEFLIRTNLQKRKFEINLRESLSWFHEKNLPLMISTEINDNQQSYAINITFDEETIDSFFCYEDIIQIIKYQIAEALADHIVDEWEEDLLCKEINKHYRQNPVEIRARVLENALDIVRSVNQNDSLSLLFNYGRKKRISQKLLKYMEENSKIFIEGFIVFNLREYLAELRYAAEVAFQEIENEKEYHDFINLLRHFVDTQDSKIAEINLLMAGKGKYFIWDARGVEIKEKLMSHYLNEILLNEVSLDDVLVSILISLSPDRIIIHNSNYKKSDDNDPVNMIRNVFQEKIVDCYNCDKCLAFQESFNI